MKSFKMRGIQSKDGVVELYDERIVLMPPTIIDLLAQVYGEGSKSLLIFLGKKMGRKMIENWDDHLRPKTLEQITRIFTEFMSTGGWGQMEPVKITEEEIVVQVKNVVSTKLPNATKHICYFINGNLAGFGEYTLYRAQVEETKCSLDDPNLDYCEYSIKKREE
ncbi:MAG: hypothetical protein Kow0069_02090 [Promethearchaeota archaeon]